MLAGDFLDDVDLWVFGPARLESEYCLDPVESFLVGHVDVQVVVENRNGTKVGRKLGVLMKSQDRADRSFVRRGNIR